jgi:hypothetical protein
MERIIRWILFVIGMLVVMGIWWDGLRRSKKRADQEENIQSSRSQGLPKELIEEPIEEKIISEEVLQITEDEPILKEEVLQDLMVSHQVE